MAIDFKNRKDFETWLRTRPKADAVVLAARAALRVLPVVARDWNRDPVGFGQSAFLTSAVLRASSLASAASKYPDQANAYDAYVDAAAACAAPVYAPTAARAAYTAAAAAAAAAGAFFSPDYVPLSSRAAARVAAAGVAAVAAVAVAAAAAAAPNDAYAAFWGTIRFDAALLADIASGKSITIEQALRGNDSTAQQDVARSPLWPHGAPVWAAQNWRELQAVLSAAEGWRVWIDWYERRLKGVDAGEKVERVFVDLTLEEWDRGPVAVNALIAERLAVAQMPKPQKFQVFVSHAWQSREIEEKVDAFIAMLKERLRALPPARKADYSVELWFDRENMPDAAETFNAATVAQCKVSDLALFLLSDRWYHSAGCKAEADCFKTNGAYDHERILKLQVTGNYDDGEFASGPVFPIRWDGQFTTLTQLWEEGNAHQRDRFVTYIRDAICRMLEDGRTRAKSQVAASDRAELLREVEARPQGSAVEIVGQRARIKTESAQDDFAVAAQPANVRAQAVVRQRASAALQKLKQLDGHWGLDEIVKTVAELEQLLGEAPESVAQNVFALWGLVVALGAFLEADDDIRERPFGNRYPLAQDCRAALERLLQMAAAFGFEFPEFRRRDENFKKFSSRNRSIQPEIDVYKDASARGRIEPKMEAMMARERAASEGVGELASAVKSWFQGTVQKMVGAFIRAASPDDPAAKGKAPEVESFLVANAPQIREMFQELPSHHRVTLRAVLDELEKGKAGSKDHGDREV